ncbi:hypothetical protein [Solidesulfovibrio sp. C21]
MSGRMWLFLGGVACSLLLAVLAGWLLDAPGASLEALFTEVDAAG